MTGSTIIGIVASIFLAVAIVSALFLDRRPSPPDATPKVKPKAEGFIRSVETKEPRT